MTKFNDEPLWVGMDVDAELARYAERDRRRAEAETATPPAPKGSRLRRGLGAAMPSLERGAAPRRPLAA